VAAAGALCALAATAEHPVGLLWFLLLPLAAGAASRLRRLGAFAGGALLGALPQLAYDWWALGSPFRLAYRYSIPYLIGPFGPEATGPDVVTREVPFSEVWSLPSLNNLTKLLLANWGLVTAAPVLALVPVGAVLLWRRGRRAEAAIPLVLLGLFVLYSACYYEPFGDTWAPRYLVAALPFLMLPLAAAAAALPAVAAALASASILVFVAVTVTHPLAGSDGELLHRLLTWPLDGHSGTVVELAGYVTWWDTLPFLAAALGAGGYAVVALARRVPSPWRADALVAAAALAGWAAFARISLDVTRDDNVAALLYLGLAAVVVAAVVALRWVARRPPFAPAADV
jgi:hypothetical protein